MRLSSSILACTRLRRSRRAVALRLAETASILGDSWSGDGVSMTATYNMKLTAALDAGKGGLVDRARPSGSRTPCVPSPFQAMRSPRSPVPCRRPSRGRCARISQRSSIPLAVTLPATYSNRYYMEGTRVEAKIVIIAQLDDNACSFWIKTGSRLLGGVLRANVHTS